LSTRFWTASKTLWSSRRMVGGGCYNYVKDCCLCYVGKKVAVCAWQEGV
jgi:hypothetical protein